MTPDLQATLRDVLKQFVQETGVIVTFVFGTEFSTGAEARADLLRRLADSVAKTESRDGATFRERT